MIQCKFNYSVEDNLKVSSVLFKEKNKSRVKIVSLVIIIFCLLGIMTSVSAIITHKDNWWVGLLSLVLLVGYFSFDFVALKIYLKKQKKFFLNSKLKDVTKVEIVKDENKIEEKFFVDDTLLGVNSYDLKNLTMYKFKDDNIYLIFNDENIVMIKKIVLTNKEFNEFNDIYKNLKEKHKKV